MRSRANILGRSTIIFLLCLLTALYTFLLIDNFKPDRANPFGYLIFSSGIFITLYGIYHCLFFYPLIIVDLSGITFKKLFQEKYYNWNEIAEIKLNGWGKINQTEAEAITMKLKNGKYIYIFMNNFIYKNVTEIRQIFARAKHIAESSKNFDTLNFEITRDESKINKGEINSETFITYSGSHYFSVYALLFYGPVIWFTFTVIDNYTASFGVQSVGILFLFVIAVSTLAYNLNYFLVSDNYLLVKKDIWFWWQNIYSLNDIQEIVIEDIPYPRAATGMRVITRNYKSKLYLADSLKKKPWKKLKEELIRKGINVSYRPDV